MTEQGIPLRELSGETKALILASEYKYGRKSTEELSHLLVNLVSSDLERIGILELMKRHGATIGISDEEITSLHSSLSANEQESREVLQTRVNPQQSEKTIFVKPPQQDAEQEPKATGSFNVKRPEGISPTRHVTFEAKKTPVPHPENRDDAFFGNDIRTTGTQFIHKLNTNKLLIADDDKRIRMVFRKRLEDKGFIVEEAEDGEKAWELIRRNDYQAVILDMKMPGLHGLEILSRLSSAGSKLPVIICSAYDQIQDDFVVSTYPKLRYLVKPVAVDALLAAIEELTPSQQ